MFPEDKGDQISLKDVGLLTLTKLVFTTSTPVVGGFSLSCEDWWVNITMKQFKKHLSWRRKRINLYGKKKKKKISRSNVSKRFHWQWCQIVPKNCKTRWRMRSPKGIYLVTVRICKVQHSGNESSAFSSRYVDIFQWQNKKIKSMLTYILLFQPCQIGSRQLSFSSKSSLKMPEGPLQLLKTVSRCWMKNSWIYLKQINVYWSFQKHLNT